MKKQILMAVLGLMIGFKALAGDVGEVADDKNELPKATQPVAMTCGAYNMLGYAKMTYDPATRIVHSIVNGVFETKYMVVSLDSRLRTGFEAMTGNSYSTIVMKDVDALESNQGYILVFNEELKRGPQRVTGHLASALLTDIAQSLFGPAMTLPLNYTPISTVTCDLSL